LFNRSSGLVLQIFFQWLTGKDAKAVMSSPTSCSIASTLGELAAEHGRDDLELVADVDRAGLGEDSVDRGRDHLRGAFGHLGEDVRQEVHPDRCQAAPSSTAAIAFFSLAWASEMTSCTPDRPRVLKERKNVVQNAPSSLSPTSNPSTSRCQSEATPVATTTAWESAR
jgi:hypothetical protein